MSNEKNLMYEAAILYYEKKYTQQEIADILGLSRQTVSKLLNDAVKEEIVEIKLHNPQKNCEALEAEICRKFSVQSAVVCNAASKNNEIRQLVTVQAAVRFILPLLQRDNLKVAVSWGRTIQEFIRQMPDITLPGNTVFPLFGATDNDSCFSSNEIARDFAYKIGAAVQFAWFPYLTDNEEDRALMEKTSYYKKIKSLWQEIDIALVGIGNKAVFDLFEETFGQKPGGSKVTGDIATHFFDENGAFFEPYKNALCASTEDLKKAGKTVGIACGDDKVKAIRGALKTKLIDVMVTDEYTARKILA